MCSPEPPSATHPKTSEDTPVVPLDTDRARRPGPLSIAVIAPVIHTPALNVAAATTPPENMANRAPTAIINFTAFLTSLALLPLAFPEPV